MSEYIHVHANMPTATHPKVCVATEYQDLSEAQTIVANRASMTIIGTNNTIDIDPSKSILEHLEINNIPIRSQCRSGICGSCRLKIISGKYKRETDFYLDEDDTASGYALACCTYPTGKITISLNAPRSTP
jgi:ferredoxin